MHIAYFSPSNAANGITTYVRHMREVLDEVTVVTTDRIEHPDGSVEFLPSPTRIQRARYGHVPAAVLNAYRAAERAGAEIFEIEETCGWASNLNGIPVVVRLHGPSCFLSDDAKRTKAELQCLKSVDGVTAPTQALIDDMAERTGWKRGKVIANPVPVPDVQWNPDNADPDQILFVGRIDKIKGAETAIRAFTEARKRRPSLKLVMGGPGDPIPADGVTFLGLQSEEEIKRLRLQSSLALCASPYETFSYTVADALALGMPVVSVRSHGPASIIRDRDTGRLCNERQLAETMLETIGRADYGQRAREFVRKWLDPKRIAAETVDFYASCSSH